MTLVLGIAWGAPRIALAQASFVLSADTDYQLRGVSLTGGRGVVRAGISYDHPSGAYGGASVIAGPRSDGVSGPRGGLAYAGYARRFGSRLTADFGVTTTRIEGEHRIQLPPNTTGAYPTVTRYTVRYRANYTEVYAGLLHDNVSVHAYLSPNYLRPGQASGYVDVNAAIHPAPRLRLFGHAGVLVPLDRRAAGRLRSRADLRIGLAVELEHAEIQVAWTALSRRAAYPPGYPDDGDSVVASASLFF